MDWTDLADLIAPAAPTLGKLIGGVIPIPFGATIGETIGKAVAGALGVAADPSVVGQTISQTRSDILQAQLAELEAQAKALAASATAEGQVGAAQVDAVNATIRTELSTGGTLQRYWRPTAMFVWILSWPFQLATILWQISSKDPASIANLATVIQALAMWNAGPAALAGVYSWNRSQEKIAAQP